MTKKIPSLSEKKLLERASRIKPVVRDKESLHFIKPVDIQSVAFTWAPELTEDAEMLHEFHRIKTYHSFGYGGLFKPSIEEVLAQLPDDIARQMVAFETFLMSQEICDGSYHLAETIIYAGELPPSIANQEIVYKKEKILSSTFEKSVRPKNSPTAQQKVMRNEQKPLKLKRRPR